MRLQRLNNGFNATIGRYLLKSRGPELVDEVVAELEHLANDVLVGSVCFGHGKDPLKCTSLDDLGGEVFVLGERVEQVERFAGEFGVLGAEVFRERHEAGQYTKLHDVLSVLRTARERRKSRICGGSHVGILVALADNVEQHLRTLLLHDFEDILLVGRHVLEGSAAVHDESFGIFVFLDGKLGVFSEVAEESSDQARTSVLNQIVDVFPHKRQSSNCGHHASIHRFQRTHGSSKLVGGAQHTKGFRSAFEDFFIVGILLETPNHDVNDALLLENGSESWITIRDQSN
mmetsp:Transcript_26968/g.42784  ORF Transcript_26968/g.42784 Transcript_26968/m.42784 type:complete len:288 (-) Transcript_26968:667-1530(-)